jgi:uncharacterized protein YkwD
MLDAMLRNPRTLTRRSPRRSAAILTIVVLAIALLGGACLDKPQRNRMLESINAARRSAGLAPLRVDPQLQAKAEAVAETMAKRRVLQHSNLTAGITRPFTRLGENVAVGSNAEEIAALFLSSPAHRANVLSPTFTLVGVAAANSGNGIYFVEEFMQPV